MRSVVILALGLLTGAEAFANNIIIPNYYRNRRAPNSGPAIGWSDRKEAAFQYIRSDSEEETNGTKTQETELTTLGPVLFYRTPANLNIEATYALLDGDEKPVAGATDTLEGSALSLGMGYELTGSPLVVAAQLATSDTDEKDGATGTTSGIEMRIIGVGVGYKLPSDVYLGFNLLRTDFEVGTTEDELDIWTIGMGQVFGDRKSPTEAYEVTLSFMNEDGTQDFDLGVKGLMNRENLQYYGALDIGKQQGDDEGDSLGLTLGADFLFSGFFVGPQLEYSTEEEKSGANTQETTEMDLSVQGGYRTERFEAALTISMENEEEEDSSPVSKDETEEQTISLRGSYFF
jgi:hypothetical protein